MLPLSLDVGNWKVLLAGTGEKLRKRLALLDDAGAGELAVHAPDPCPALRAQAGARLVERLPDAAEIAAARVLFVAGLPIEVASPLAEIARAHRVLVNVEDERAWCDFHVPAIVRRGALLLTVSTGGGSPALAQRLRAALESQFGPEWAGRLEEVAALRDRARAAGASTAEVQAISRRFVAEKGWLEPSASS